MNYPAKSDGTQVLFCAKAIRSFVIVGTKTHQQLKTLKNQQLTGEKNAKSESAQERSFLTPEKNVRDRLLELIGDDSVAAFSRSTGVAESSLRAYLNRGIKPGMDHLAAISEAKGVTVDWLATGREPRLRADVIKATGGLDKQRLQDAIAAVEEGLRAAQKRLSPDKHAELISLIYETEGPINRAFVVRMITFSPA